MISPVSKEELGNKNIYVGYVSELTELLEAAKSQGKYFICGILCDSTEFQSKLDDEFWSKLLDGGLVYLCAWGKTCEVIHDICDEYISHPDRFEQYTDDKHIMTTWHSKETLEEALWFTVANALPADGYFEDCRSILILGLESEPFVEIARRELADLKELWSKVE